MIGFNKYIFKILCTERCGSLNCGPKRQMYQPTHMARRMKSGPSIDWLHVFHVPFYMVFQLNYQLWLKLIEAYVWRTGSNCLLQLKSTFILSNFAFSFFL
jgi:hypothetical protein